MILSLKIYVSNFKIWILARKQLLLKSNRILQYKIGGSSKWSYKKKNLKDSFRSGIIPRRPPCVLCMTFVLKPGSTMKNCSVLKALTNSFARFNGFSSLFMLLQPVIICNDRCNPYTFLRSIYWWYDIEKCHWNDCFEDWTFYKWCALKYTVWVSE